MKNYLAGVFVTAIVCAITEVAYRRGKEDGIKCCKCLVEVANNLANSINKKNEEEA